MAKLELAVWCEPGRDAADFHRTLVDRWAAGAGRVDAWRVRAAQNSSRAMASWTISARRRLPAGVMW